VTSVHARPPASDACIHTAICEPDIVTKEHVYSWLHKQAESSRSHSKMGITYDDNLKYATTITRTALAMLVDIVITHIYAL